MGGQLRRRLEDGIARSPRTTALFGVEWLPTPSGAAGARGHRARKWPGTRGVDPGAAREVVRARGRGAPRGRHGSRRGAWSSAQACAETWAGQSPLSPLPPTLPADDRAPIRPHAHHGNRTPWVCLRSGHTPAAPRADLRRLAALAHGGPGGPGPRARRCRAPRPSACSRPLHARARRGRLRGRGGSARCTASQGRGLRRARPLPLGCGAARGYHDRTSLGALEQHRSDHGVLILGRPRTDLRLGGRSHRRAPAPGDPDSGPIRGQDGHRLLRVRSRRGRARPAAPADDPEIGRRAVRRRPARLPISGSSAPSSGLRRGTPPPCVRLASEITRGRTNGSRGSVAARTVNAKRGRSRVGGRAHTTRSPR